MSDDSYAPNHAQLDMLLCIDGAKVQTQVTCVYKPEVIKKKSSVSEQLHADIKKNSFSTFFHVSRLNNQGVDVGISKNSSLNVTLF